MTIQVTNDKLMLLFLDSDGNVSEGVCLPVSETRFAWAGGLIEFQITDDGTEPALTAMKVYEFRRLSPRTEL